MGASERIRRADVRWEDLGDEIIIRHGPKGQYLALNHTGATLWRCLAKRVGEEQLAEVLMTRHGAAKEEAVRDVRAFLAQLGSHGLLS